MRPAAEYTTKDGRTYKRSFPSVRQAMEAAQGAVYGKSIAGAEVYNRKGKVVIRYFFDGKLQYIEY